MSRTLDYGLYARQIALPELGPRGQHALSVTAVDLWPAPTLASHLYARAGGIIEADSPLCIEGPAPITGAAQELGVSAWLCVEAARRVMGQSACAMSDALLARLAVPSATTKP